MDNFRFKSLEELYKRLFPALNAKREELKRRNIKIIEEIDIWNYLRKNYWQNKSSLTLGEMVDDILSLKDEEIINFKLNKKTSNNNLL